ncbi:arsenical pump-driving ATPase [Undibacterium luofuense]|uniref:Arsenical pump-driving ATPase n=1 Tax=Undibacterium luofuense TaxID=2828733 RepID=A0A941DMZ0_9BURK|nr:arsenical pump-driving ATPase [Undibacterium luofuense]MBR7783853.1 arsenical pump-driving ATPase [Undibacterium luofuense]
MHFLQRSTPFLFFTGKGGVGKTSVACACAIHLCHQGKKVLLVSTDPASNISQIFRTPIGNRITALQENLWGLEIDPQAAADLYRKQIIDPVRGIAPDTVVRQLEEQLSGVCTNEIAAFDEFTGLLTDAAIREQFDHIVLDTAPTGHTIRLLQLPSAWSQFLEEGKGNASCLGPLAGLQKQRHRYQAAVAALADPAQTSLVLVSRAQQSALSEVARTCSELSTAGLRPAFLVINGLMPQASAELDPLANAIYAREQSALKHMPELLRQLHCDYLPLKAANLSDPQALAGLFETENTVSADLPPTAVAADSLAAMLDELAQDKRGFIMLMGKGGVGKTTLAAAIATGLADRGFPVHLTTSDPAAHITETLDAHLPNLKVSRIDPHAATEAYRQQVRLTKGSKLDAAGKALLEEDLKSPCTEEIAVFQAFSRVIRESSRQFVVMDTAPTGHTLLLLDATGAYHREISRQMADKSMHFMTPMMQLQDPVQTKVIIVTLAETTPVLEASALQNDLRRAGIEPWGWIINQSIAAARPTAPLLRQRALYEQEQIRQVRDVHAKRCALVKSEAEEPRGTAKLRSLVQRNKQHENGG